MNVGSPSASVEHDHITKPRAMSLSKACGVGLDWTGFGVVAPSRRATGLPGLVTLRRTLQRDHSKPGHTVVLGYPRAP